MMATGGGLGEPYDARIERARALLAESDVIDLHTESFVWTRVFGYDLRQEHGHGLLRARLYSQADLPRLRAGGLTGVVLSIATNPFRLRSALASNVARLGGTVEGDPKAAVVADLAAYRRARADGRLACFIAIQGANTVKRADALPAVVSRVTLVHLTRSRFGAPSTPMGGRQGLTEAGCELVAALTARRVLVDLAHASRDTFWDALAVHEQAVPPIVSHTGAAGVHQSWRNLEDEQIRAIADRGGVVGIMYHRGFIGGSTAEAVLRHLDHVVDVGGEDTAALGSDWDGFIVTPRDMPTAADLPVLVEGMLARGWPEARVRKVVGGNYLRVMAAVRPGS